MKRSLEDVICMYRKYVSFPEPTSAKFSRKSKADNLVINTTWKQADLERSENVKFCKNYIIKHGQPNQFDVQFTNIVTENNEVWNQESPSGKLTAIVRNIKTKKEEEKQYIEVWDDRQKIKNYEVTSLEKHGKICDPDGQFGCLRWSSTEKKLLYIAERKKPKAVSYFDSKPKNKNKKSEDEEKPEQGKEHDYVDEWGEQLTGKCSPVVCILDIDCEPANITVLDDILEDYSQGQAIWAPSDTGVVFTGWKNTPYRLGLIYCPIREGGIYYWNKETDKCELLSDSKRSCSSPRFSPDGSKLIYIDNEIGGPHYQCSRLMMCDWSTKDSKVVLDIVKERKGDEFPGLFLLSLPTRCWTTDSKWIVCSSAWASKAVPLIVNVEDKSVTRCKIKTQGDALVLDVLDNVVTVKCSSLNQPPYICAGSLPAAGVSELSLCPIDDPVTLPDIEWKVLSFQPTDRPHSKFGALDYNAVLIMPKSTGSKPPLIVFPHGGPHTCFTEGYILYTACFVSCGFAVLYVNYRGSIGLGDNNIRSLPGNVGDQDVKDCQAAAEQVVKSGKVDADKVAVFGGSHGGFLTAHLIGQYPKFYKVGCCRNPVTNLATMVGTTDIPDWVFYEAGYDFDHKAELSEKILADMWNKSPIRYVNQVEAPCLVMLGADDLRVPTKQGREYYRKLKAYNKTTRLISYEGNSHPIIKVDSQADAFINIVEWFRQYLS